MSALLFDYPDSQIELDGAGFKWWGRIQPTPMSLSYLVEIAWQPRKRAVVRVLDPEIEDRAGKPPPHIFKGRDLCLHLHEEWTYTCPVSTTLVPWSSMWLFFYEIWLFTGEWTGGGHQFGDGSEPQRAPLRSGLSPKRTQGRSRRR